MFMVVQRFRSSAATSGCSCTVHLHALVTDGAFEEGGGGVRFLPASPPTPERMTAVLAHVHKVLGSADEGDLDMDPALRTCVQLALAPARIWSRRQRPRPRRRSPCRRWACTCMARRE